MSESISDLERDIEASRARLDETIDKLQGRLSASSLVDEMLGSARRTPTLNGLYDNALAAVRKNPVPVLLIAAGVGMLMSRISGEARRPYRNGAIVPAEPVMPKATIPTLTETDAARKPASVAVAEPVPGQDTRPGLKTINPGLSPEAPPGSAGIA